MLRGRAQELWSNLASATANGTGVPQSLLDAKAAEVQKRAEAQRLIEVCTDPIFAHRLSDTHNAKQ